MKIKAFSFEQNSYALAPVKQSVTENITESGMFFESFSDANVLFNEISAALSSSDAILLGVESELFLKFKPILIKAFSFTPAYSEKIDKKIGSKITDAKLRKAHTLVPDECSELLSDDGLFSGFYVKSQEQYIVVFPLLEDALPHMLTESDLPFFKSHAKSVSVPDNVEIDPESLSQAEAIVAKLIKNDIKLAIPSTPAAKLLKEEIKNCPNNENIVLFTPFVNDEGISDPKEYAAQLAKGAMDLRSTELGATISNIFREKKGETVTNYYSFIAVATADKIVVKKLFADTGENVDNLIAEATTELYTMMDKYLDEVIFKKTATDEEKAKYEQALIEAEYQADARPSASIGKKGTIAAIIILAIAVIVCVILGFKFGGYFVKPSDAPEAQSLQSGGTTAGTVPAIPENTEPDYTEYNSEPGSTTDIFDIDPTENLIPVPNTDRPVINYTPNNNQGSGNNEKPKEEETEKPSETEKETTTEPKEEPTEDFEGAEW